MEFVPRVGVCSIAFKERSAEQALRAIAAAGADCVELWGQPPHLPYPVDAGWCAALREQAGESGLSICALGSYFRPGAHPSYGGRPVTKENQLAAARALGAPVIRIWPGTAARDATAPAARERIYAEIRDFADAARDAGVTVVLERHSGTLTEGWDAPLAVLREIAHPAVALNYQVVYPAPAKDLAARAADDYRRLLPHARHAHLQNYAAAAGGRPPRTLVVDGVVDYGRLGATARACGYDGAFMIEFPADERRGMSVEDAVRADVAGVRRLLSAPAPAP